MHEQQKMRGIRRLGTYRWDASFHFADLPTVPNAREPRCAGRGPLLIFFDSIFLSWVIHGLGMDWWMIEIRL